MHPHLSQSHRNHKLIACSPRLLAPAAWAVAICWLSLTPTPPQVPGPLGWDKLLHTGAYALLAWLLAWSLELIERRHLALVVLSVTAFGALLEVLQLLAHTGRLAEWRDLFADALGALVACVVFRHCAMRDSRHDQHG